MLTVSNTSPLSNLIVIGQIQLLQQIYPQVLIPEAVYVELLRFDPIKPVILDLTTVGWLTVEPVKSTENIRLGPDS